MESLNSKQGLSVELPKDINKLKRQIRALEGLIENDIRSEDKKIHKEALQVLKKELRMRELKSGEEL